MFSIILTVLSLVLGFKIIKFVGKLGFNLLGIFLSLVVIPIVFFPILIVFGVIGLPIVLIGGLLALLFKALPLILIGGAIYIFFRYKNKEYSW